MSPPAVEPASPLHVVANQVHYYCDHIRKDVERAVDLLENDSANRARDMTTHSRQRGGRKTRDRSTSTRAEPDADVLQAIQSIVRLKHVVSCLAWLPSAGHVRTEFATIVDRFWRETRRRLNAIEVELSELSDNGSAFSALIARLKEISQLHQSLGNYALWLLDGPADEPDISDVKRFAALQDSPKRKSGWIRFDPADEHSVNRRITRQTIAEMLGYSPRSLEYYYRQNTNCPKKKRLPDPVGNKGKAKVYRLSDIVEWAKEIGQSIAWIPPESDTGGND